MSMKDIKAGLTAYTATCDCCGTTETVYAMKKEQARIALCDQGWTISLHNRCEKCRSRPVFGPGVKAAGGNEEAEILLEAANGIIRVGCLVAWSPSEVCPDKIDSSEWECVIKIEHHRGGRFSIVTGDMLSDGNDLCWSYCAGIKHHFFVKDKVSE